MTTERYLAARAIQLFAGASRRSTTSGCSRARTTRAVDRTGEGRAINRHDYTAVEIDVALQRPVVRRLLDLVRLRNTHAAFDGELSVEADDEHSIRLQWVRGDLSVALEVDFASGQAVKVDHGSANADREVVGMRAFWPGTPWVELERRRRSRDGHRRRLLGCDRWQADDGQDGAEDDDRADPLPWIEPLTK